MPKLVKIDAGLKSNVVPGKAKAVVAGVEDAVLNETAAACYKRNRGYNLSLQAVKKES